MNFHFNTHGKLSIYDEIINYTWSIWSASWGSLLTMLALALHNPGEEKTWKLISSNNIVEKFRLPHYWNQWCVVEGFKTLKLLITYRYKGPGFWETIISENFPTTHILLFHTFCQLSFGYKLKQVWRQHYAKTKSNILAI